MQFEVQFLMSGGVLIFYYEGEGSLQFLWHYDALHSEDKSRLIGHPRWELEGDGQAIMWTRPLWPLQLGVERVQDIELHGFEEAVTLVFKYNRHHHLTAILQVSLDVINLSKKENLFIIIIKYMYLLRE